MIFCTAFFASLTFSHVTFGLPAKNPCFLFNQFDASSRIYEVSLVYEAAIISDAASASQQSGLSR